MAKRRFRGILLTAISFVALVLPLLVLMLWKRNEWFAFEVDGTKVSIGFIVALIFVICLLKGAFKELDKRFTTIFVLAILSVVTWLLDSIIQDLTLILIAAIVGYISYIVVNSFGKRDLDYTKEYNSERARVDARKDVKELDGSV